jgi:hypothetical protein
VREGGDVFDFLVGGGRLVLGLTWLDLGLDRWGVDNG